MGAWGAQSVKWRTLGFSSGQDPYSPRSGFAFSRESAPSLLPLPPHFLSNKFFQLKNFKSWLKNAISSLFNASITAAILNALKFSIMTRFGFFSPKYRYI